MKILSLDIGDQWTGSALSDALYITCKPYKTIPTSLLDHFLQDLFTKESIEAIVVGYPKTIRGTHSQQTEKCIAQFNRLKTTFTRVNNRTLTWHLWDERLSSKRAEQLYKESKRTPKNQTKKKHSIAAAFILQSFLDYRALKREPY